MSNALHIANSNLIHCYYIIIIYNHICLFIFLNEKNRYTVLLDFRFEKKKNTLHFSHPSTFFCFNPFFLLITRTTGRMMKWPYLIVTPILSISPWVPDCDASSLHLVSIQVSPCCLFPVVFVSGRSCALTIH